MNASNVRKRVRKCRVATCDRPSRLRSSSMVVSPTVLENLDLDLDLDLYLDLAGALRAAVDNSAVSGMLSLEGTLRAPDFSLRIVLHNNQHTDTGLSAEETHRTPDTRFPNSEAFTAGFSARRAPSEGEPAKNLDLACATRSSPGESTMPTM